MEIDFNFRKERKLGEIVQDFINLIRQIHQHFFGTMLRLSIVPLCMMLLLIYFGTTKVNLTSQKSLVESMDVILIGIGVLLLMLFIAMLLIGLTIEYFILLKTNKRLDFDAGMVWLSFRANFGKYWRFMLMAILALLILAIPVTIVMGIMIFIPFVGSFAAGIVSAIMGVCFFCAFLFYREGYARLNNTLTGTFSILKKKLLDYSIASFLIGMIFQILLFMMTLTPSLILGLIAYNTIGFEATFFDTFLGRILVSIGGTLIGFLYIVYYMLSVLVSGIIYETAKEIAYGEDIYERIARLGEEAHDN